MQNTDEQKMAELLFAYAKEETNDKKWVFRLTEDDDDLLQNVVVWITTQCHVRYAVKEVGDAGHLHIHVMLTETFKKKKQIMEAFHKMFKNRWKNVKGAFSCCQQEQCDWNNYIYLSKGTRTLMPCVIYKPDYVLDDHVREFHRVYWADKPIEKDLTVNRKTGEPKKKRELDWSERLTKEIREAHPGRIFRYNMVDIDDLMGYVMRALGKTSKKLSAKIVSELVMGQLNALGHGQCESLAIRMRQNAFPDLFPNGHFHYDA